MSTIFNDKRLISTPDVSEDEGKRNVISDEGNLNRAGQWKDPWAGPAVLQGQFSHGWAT